MSTFNRRLLIAAFSPSHPMTAGDCKDNANRDQIVSITTFCLKLSGTFHIVGAIWQNIQPKYQSRNYLFQHFAQKSILGT